MESLSAISPVLPFQVSSGGSGFTFEGQGMTLSAPGTEAFKQDFARWEQLRQQASPDDSEQVKSRPTVAPRHKLRR